MFSGIIKTVGTIKSVTEKNGGREYCIAYNLKRKWKIGESVMIGGICSTIIKKTEPTITVFYMPETLQKTTAITWSKGARVNIEPSLKMGDDISGHIVSGHVDTKAKVRNIEKQGKTKRITFSLSKEYARYIVSKGSIAVDGVSLTVVDAKKDSFSVALIPYTLAHTTLGVLKEGDAVNIEVDMMAKYIEKFVALHTKK